MQYKPWQILHADVFVNFQQIPGDGSNEGEEEEEEAQEEREDEKKKDQGGNKFSRLIMEM